MKTLLAIILITSLFFTKGKSQSLPPIFDKVPTHILETHSLVSFPKNTWLENIVNGNDGNLYVTNYPEGKILKISLEGKVEDYARVEGKIAGITRFKENEFLIVGWDKAGKPSVFLLDSDKNTSIFTPIEGGIFPNGILSIGKDQYLISDSYAGCIWILNAKKRTTEIWLKDELLSRTSEKSESPAANGIKLYKGNIYVANSEKHLLIKIPFAQGRPGKPEIYLSNVFIDDFGFDAKGNIYAAANIYNYVLKISPNKSVSIISGIDQGAAGPTAVLILRNKKGKEILYIPTCGGMGVPPPSGIQEGKVLEIIPD